MQIKKMLNISLVYAVAAMVGGVFYREFTKILGFTGITALSKVHAHLFILGMVGFLLVAVFCKVFDLSDNKRFKKFMIFYNIGLPLTAIMLLVRGVTQVSAINLSRAVTFSISGVAGIGHVMLGVGMIFLILSLKQVAVETN